MRGAARDVAVVIPSNRTISDRSLRGIPDEVPIVVVNDGTGVIQPTRPAMQVFDRESIGRVMGADRDLIPSGSSACRNFGFYYLWKYTDCARVISIDDDVEVAAGFVDAYDLLGRDATLDTVRGAAWVNTIALFNDARGIYARGFPFEARDGGEPEWQRTTARVVAHMGLWDTVLDTHAIDKHLFEPCRRERPELTLARDVVRIGTQRERVHFPMSSMNFGFVRDVLPILYQMPMASHFVDRYPLGRFEDIWAGYVAQALIARRGEAITVGAPIVRHLKLGDLRSEMACEHYGVLVSPYFYRVVDAAVDGVAPASYADMYGSLCDRILALGETSRRSLSIPPLYWAHIHSIFTMAARWSALCLRTRSTV